MYFCTKLILNITSVSGNQETTRQKKFARMIQKEITPLLNTFMQKFPGILASVPYVRVSPDLMVLRIYITTFPDDQVELVVKELNENTWELRRDLAALIRHGVRKIPDIHFFADDTVLYARKMDDLFKKIHSETPERPSGETEGED